MNPEFGVLRRGLGINIDLNYKFNYPKSGGGGGGREAGCSLVTRGGRSHSGSTVASGSSSYRWETVKTGQLLKTLPRLAVTKGIAVKSTGSNPHPQSSPIHVREIARPTSLSLSLSSWWNINSYNGISRVSCSDLPHNFLFFFRHSCFRSPLSFERSRLFSNFIRLSFVSWIE